MVTSWSWTLPDPYAPFDGIKENYGITYGPDKKILVMESVVQADLQIDMKMLKDGGQYKKRFYCSMWDTYRTSVPGADNYTSICSHYSPLDSQEIVKKVRCKCLCVRDSWCKVGPALYR